MPIEYAKVSIRLGDDIVGEAGVCSFVPYSPQQSAEVPLSPCLPITAD